MGRALSTPFPFFSFRGVFDVSINVFRISPRENDSYSIDAMGGRFLVGKGYLFLDCVSYHDVAFKGVIGYVENFVNVIWIVPLLLDPVVD